MPKPIIVAAIPAYDEEIAIGSVVLRAKKYVDAVIVIDDGSSDATSLIAALAGAEIISHEHNQGKGVALKDAFRRANELKADILVCLDADGQHNPDEIPILLIPIITNQADMVIGSRFLDVKSEIPAYRRAGQGVLNFLTNKVSHSSVTDSQSGFRAFSRKAIESLSLDEGGIGIESFVQRAAHDQNLRVAEVPITCRYDVEHASKMGSVRHGFSVVNTLLKIVEERRPLLVFGSVGLGIVIVGLALEVRVVDIFSQTQQLAIGTTLIGIVMIILGILSIFTGITLHAISRVLVKMKQ
jgi:glycosyltransferase involved in cell wall biosynthesis